MKGGTQGTVRLLAKFTEFESCGDAFCFEGRRVGFFRIERVIADCQRLFPEATLKVGDLVPVFADDALIDAQTGDTLEIGCLVEAACSDSCNDKTPPATPNASPCAAHEWGCRTRCYEPVVYRAGDG